MNNLQTKKQKLADFIVFFLVGSLYAWGICCHVLSCTILPFEPNLVFFILLGWMLFYSIVFYNSRTIVGFSVIICIAIVLVALDLSSQETIEGFYANAWLFLHEVYYFIIGYMPYQESYFIFTLSVLCAVIAFYVTAAVRLSFHFVSLFLFGVVVFAVSASFGYAISDIYFFAFLFSLLVFFMKSLHLSLATYTNTKHKIFAKKTNNQHKSNGVYALCAIPICAFLLIVAFVLPSAPQQLQKPNSNFAMNLIKYPVETISNSMYTLFSPKYYSSQSVGFSNHQNLLGGNIAPSALFVMSVITNEPTYLTGATKDIYTGYSWVNSTPDFESYEPSVLPLLDYSVGYYTYVHKIFKNTNQTDLLFALPKLHFDWSQQMETAEINIGSARTGSIFSSPNQMNLQMPVPLRENNHLQKNPIGDIRTSELLPKNFTYTLSFLSKKKLYERDASILQTSQKGAYQELLQALLNQRKSRFSLERDPIYFQLNENEHHLVSVLETQLVPYAEEMYARYTNLPEGLPQRVKQLAQDLTKPYDTDFDKMKAIETYLRSYTYDLNPGNLPPQTDFVDYFLFESKVGYCTYFATAMAVMGRAVGLPTRYVEGYVLPSHQDEWGRYLVTTAEAHAWPEVYFEGYGWYAFEPTAAYQTREDLLNKSLAMETFAQNNSDSTLPFYNDDYGYEEEFLDDFYDPSSINATISSNLKQNTTKPTIFIIFVWVMMSILCFFLLGIATMGIVFMLQKYKVKKISNKQAVLWYYKAVLHLIQRLDERPNKNETASSYAKRIGKRYSFLNQTIFLSEITAIYEKARYASCHISDEERKLLTLVHKEMKQIYLNRHSIFAIGWLYLFFRETQTIHGYTKIN